MQEAGTTTTSGIPQRPDDDVPETLVGISFDDAFRAQEFLTATQRMAASQQLVLKDAVIVVHDHDGKTKVHETVDPQPKRTALSGALWVSLVGLLVAGPVGWLAGAAVGAGAGVVTAKAIDLGIPDEWVEWFRSATRPGTATLALLVTHLDRDALIGEAERFRGARIVHTNLDDSTLRRIHGALGQLDPAAGS
jgi:uncharacterized membrane protein